jgi:hypothetical protein
MIIARSRRRGYQLHAPDSPEAEALLTERGLTRADLDLAIAELACPMRAPSRSYPCSGREPRRG